MRSAEVPARSVPAGIQAIPGRGGLGSALLAEAAGDPEPLGHEAALAARRSVGPEDVGNFAFSVLAKRITIEYPELADHAR